MGVVVVDFNACEHEKIRLGHVGMIDDDLVIRQRKDLVALGFIGFLYFSGGELAIGNGAVGMKIGLKIPVNNRKKMLLIFHGDSLLYRNKYTNNIVGGLYKRTSRLVP